MEKKVNQTSNNLNSSLSLLVGALWVYFEQLDCCLVQMQPEVKPESPRAASEPIPCPEHVYGSCNPPMCMLLLIALIPKDTLVCSF